MRIRNRFSAGTIVLCGLSAGAATFLAGGKTAEDGWLLDTALAARAMALPTPIRRTPSVAVIAVDAGSLAQPELAPYPRAFFAPVWADLIDALARAKARTIAFDFLFSYTANDFRPGYDRPFLKALAEKGDRVVLGRSAATLPTTPYMAAIKFDPAALGLLELPPDSDGVVRQVPTDFQTTDGDRLPTLVSAALRRAGVRSVPDTIWLAPRRHLESMPSYALIDVLRCAKAAPERLAAAFADRVVFIGTTLPEEDRKLSPGRLLSRPASAPKQPSAPCTLVRPPPSVPASYGVPGVFLHAAAAESVLGGQTTRPVGTTWRVLAAGFAAVIGALIGVTFMPWTAAAATLGAGLAIWCAEVVLLQFLRWYPASPAMMALLGSVVVAYLMRYVVEDRRRRRIQNAFDHYLSPYVVDGLMESDEQLKLGGVHRDVSILFVDLSGFTEASTHLEPEELIQVTNRYFGTVVDVVESAQGYVVQFVGDEVMAMWGAPVQDADHAKKAVSAALRCADKLALLHRELAARGETAFWFKIGVNTGPAVVGNIGSENRYNYAAVGEVVNIASRLNGLPPDYGCTVIVSEATFDRLDGAYLACELDKVRVVGKEDPVAILEPLAPETTATSEQRRYVEGYRQALADYRRRAFGEAARLWEALDYPPRGRAPDTPDGDLTPPRAMAHRAARFAEMPPPSPWDGAWTKETK